MPGTLSNQVFRSGQQHELLDWLRETTFPMEAKYADVEFARRAYDATVKRIINSGVSRTYFFWRSWPRFWIFTQTTTCCYYGSLHLEATKALAEIVHAYGLSLNLRHFPCILTTDASPARPKSFRRGR